MVYLFYKIIPKAYGLGTPKSVFERVSGDLVWPNIMGSFLPSLSLTYAVYRR